MGCVALGRAGKAAGLAAEIAFLVVLVFEGLYRKPLPGSHRLLVPLYYPYRWLRGLRRVGGMR